MKSEKLSFEKDLWNKYNLLHERLRKKNEYIKLLKKLKIIIKKNLGFGDWGLGIGDWVLGIVPNPQSPIPNPQSPIPIKKKINLYNIFNKDNFYFL